MTTVLWCRQPLCIITPQLELAKRKKQKVNVLCIRNMNVFIMVIRIGIFPDCQDASRAHRNFRRMLAAIPRLFSVFLPFP